jgi:hypothetical protein
MEGRREMAAGWFVDALAAYALIGAVFAAIFVMFGIHRVDPAAGGAPFSFRLIVVPGVAALWPLLLARWIRGTRP